MKTLLSCSKSVRYVVILICCMRSITAFAMDFVVNQDNHYAYFNVNSYLSYYEDFNKSETIESVLGIENWTKNNTGKVLNFGFVDYPVWVRFPADMDQPKGHDWHLVIPYPLLQHANVYLVSESSRRVLWRTSLKATLQKKDNLRSHHINFSLPKIEEKGAYFYLKASSNTSLQLPLELWDRNYLIVQQNVETLLWGLYFGVVFALMLYNSFLFLSMRDSTYAYYVFTLLSILFLMLSISGLGNRYVWSNPQLTYYSLPISASMTSFGLLAFCLSFLKAENIRPVVRIFMQALAPLCLLAAVFVTYMPEFGAVLTGWLGAFTIVLVMAAGISALLNGQVIARYFVIATTCFSVGAIVYIANVFGVLPSSRLTNHGIQAGSALEALLFSFALAHRIKEERRQKLIAMEKMEMAQRTIVQVQNQALQQALHDPVTRKPNESLLSNRVNELISEEQRIDTFALVLMSFPQIKQIASSMGRRLSEDVLESVIARLEHELSNNIQTLTVEKSPNSNVAVEEFGSVIVICKIGEGYRSVNDFVGQLVNLYESAIQIGETSIQVDAFCGIASYPKHGDRADLLLQHASAARDFGLRTGEAITIYSSEIDTFGRRRLALVGALSQAVRDEELELYLQPQFECVSQNLVGAEVLLRWTSEKFGTVSPAEFIEIAEEAGLMAQITRYVIDEAFSILHALHSSSFPIKLSINLSIHNLTEPKFVRLVVLLAEKHMINLADVVFEVTETAMSKDMDTVVQTLHQLAAAGCSISLDDYGTGYSSLAYLSQLPINELKIDRAFVSQMERMDSNYRIVENTVKLARALQIETVAEGVENQKTLNSLLRIGCNRVQGFHFAKPMPVSQFREWILRRAC